MATNHALRVRGAVPEVFSRTAIEENMLALVLYQETHCLEVELLMALDLRLHKRVGITGHLCRRVDGPNTNCSRRGWELQVGSWLGFDVVHVDSGL